MKVIEIATRFFYEKKKKIIYRFTKLNKKILYNYIFI